jgi:hypothetical protein
MLGFCVKRKFTQRRSWLRFSDAVRRTKTGQARTRGAASRSMGIWAFYRTRSWRRRVVDQAEEDAANETLRPVVGGIGACRSRCSVFLSRSWQKARGWRSPEQRALRRWVRVFYAGSRRHLGRCASAGRCARLHPALERLDDAHAPATAGTRWTPIERL